MALRYAELERKLGEIDRSRAIFTYASQFCDPRVYQSLHCRHPYTAHIYADVMVK